ncbi:MAG: SAM-dependent methyltransferase [Opitutales bacterium]
MESMNNLNDEQIKKYIFEKIEEAMEENGYISLAEFVDICLFKYAQSYYRADRNRTGTNGDFYTNSNLKGNIFARLVEDCAKNFLGKNPSKIVEIGAEPKKALFASSQVLPLGAKLKIEGDDILVFSNELLDSRPFDRYVMQNNQWQKTYLKLENTKIVEFLMPASLQESKFLDKYFIETFDGYTLDFSFDAIKLFEDIVGQNWTGTLIFIDYFRTTFDLKVFESGTRRRYKNQDVHLDIFSEMGVSDITFNPHIESLEDILRKAGFSDINYTSQEAFLMNNSREVLCDIVANSSSLSPEKGALMELLSPAYMGAVFRVLWAKR